MAKSNAGREGASKIWYSARRRCLNPAHPADSSPAVQAGVVDTPPPWVLPVVFLLFGIEACWSCSAGFHVVALFAQSSSELRVVRIESHVYEFDSLVWIMIRDCAWFSAEPLVFAAASVLGVAGACAVWVSCEHLPAKRLMSLGVVWVASTGTGAVPLGSGAGVAFACRCLDEVRTSGCRADSPAHVCLAVIVSVGVSWCPRLAYL
jgi:hypothetical protein